MLYCTPAEMRIEGEEFLMPLENITQGILEMAKSIDSRWKEACAIVCKKKYIPEHQVRRLVSLICDVTHQIDDFKSYAGALNTEGLYAPAITVTIDISSDAADISKSLEMMSIFLKKYALLSERDSTRWNSLVDEINNTLLELMYTSENLTDEDGTIFIICIS